MNLSGGLAEAYELTDAGTSMDKLREAVAEAVYVFDPVWIPANAWKGLQISPGHHLTWSQCVEAGCDAHYRNLAGAAIEVVLASVRGEPALATAELSDGVADCWRDNPACPMMRGNDDSLSGYRRSSTRRAAILMNAYARRANSGGAWFRPRRPLQRDAAQNEQPRVEPQNARGRQRPPVRHLHAHDIRRTETAQTRADDGEKHAQSEFRGR